MMYLKLNLLVISLLIALNDGKQFRFDYDYYPEADGWLKLHRIPATWTDARLRCFREGAVLASPESEPLLWSMRTLLRDKRPRLSHGVFSGISSKYSKGDFYSITGTPLSRMPVRWAPAEPENQGNAEDCLLMLVNGTFADVKCSNVYPYICYRRDTSATVTQCGTVDTGYTLDSRTGSCYKFHREPQTWPRAFLACSGEGGYLAIINSNTESQVLKDLFARYPDIYIPGEIRKDVVHIGHSNWGEHGLFMTVHGQTIEEAGFAMWHEGEPDAVADSREHCGGMFRDGLLDDIWCTQSVAFICEKSPDSLLPDEQL